MTPENGGKFELRLGESSSDSARYSALLQTAAQSWRGTAQVGARAGAAQVELGAWDQTSQPPEWLLDDARAALKAALRTSQGGGRWPRRIARWRPEPA